MARIRSIHQGFFTDERLVSCSAFARLLFIGLWTDADDQGIFEWKPVTIKMKLFPVDNIDIPGVLSELLAADAIGKFQHAGREYGAIRNFRKFQRPKSPNAIHPMVGEWGNYVGLTPRDGENADDDPPRIPQKVEKSPQMEEGGGRGQERDGGAKSAINLSKPPDPDAELFRRGKVVLGASAGGQIAKLKTLFGGDVAKTREFIEGAAAKENPAQYAAATISKNSARAPDGRAALQKGAYDSAL